MYSTFASLGVNGTSDVDCPHMSPVRSYGSLDSDTFSESFTLVACLQAITFESEAQASYF